MGEIFQNKDDTLLSLEFVESHALFISTQNTGARLIDWSPQVTIICRLDSNVHWTAFDVDFST